MNSRLCGSGRQRAPLNKQEYSHDLLNSISVQPKALELPQSLSASEVLIIAEGHEALLESVPKLPVCKKLRFDSNKVSILWILPYFFRLERI